MNIDVDIIDGRLVARLRRWYDPVSSLSAARELVESGHYGKQCTRVLLALVDNPGVTSRELADISGIDLAVLFRRLPDLEKGGVVSRGTIRKCKSGNRLATTWNATL
jgi:DNA-binding MarR family transcriptional regulator